MNLTSLDRNFYCSKNNGVEEEIIIKKEGIMIWEIKQKGFWGIKQATVELQSGGGKKHGRGNPWLKAWMKKKNTV